VNAGGGTRGLTPRAVAAGFALLAALGGTFACSEEVAQTPVEAYCSGICRAATRCHVAATTCSSACAAQSSFAERYSLEGAKHFGDCLAELDCTVFSDDDVWHRETDACWQSSKPRVTVTARVRSLCSREVTASFECGWSDSTRQCELDLGMWSDDVLDDVTACLPKTDCEKLEICMKGVFESP